MIYQLINYDLVKSYRYRFYMDDPIFNYYRYDDRFNLVIGDTY